MISPVFKWLTVDDFSAYGELCCMSAEHLKKIGKEGYVDFLPVPLAYAAINEGRLAALWIGEKLAATIIIEQCDLEERLHNRFTGDDISLVSNDGIYLRNGMVSPQFQGLRLYNKLMSDVANSFPNHMVIGTINTDNIAPQKSCMAAGMLPIGQLIRKKDGINSTLFCRMPIAQQIKAVA